jgi:hypothetical protein
VQLGVAGGAQKLQALPVEEKRKRERREKARNAKRNEKGTNAERKKER